MPKVDIAKKRNDHDAEVLLQSFLDAGGINDHETHSLVPFSWGEDWGKIAPRLHSIERDILIPLGKKKDGDYLTLNLSAGLSLLVAGSALSGVGVFRRTALLSLLKEHTPDTLQLVLIDPINALTDFSDIPHLAVPHAVSSDQCGKALEWCRTEFQRRDDLLSAETGLLYQYNASRESTSEMLPSVVIVVTEVGELTDESGDYVRILADIQSMSRAYEMHTILTTQRPSLDYIPEQLLKGSCARIAFQLPYKEASNLILGKIGAEKLLGQGDGLYIDIYNDELLAFQGFHVDIDDTTMVLNKTLRIET